MQWNAKGLDGFGCDVCGTGFVPGQGDQRPPEQGVFVLDFAADGADHEAQVESAWGQAADGSSAGVSDFHAGLSQVGVFLQVVEVEVDGGAVEGVDPGLGGTLEGDVDGGRVDLTLGGQEGVEDRGESLEHSVICYIYGSNRLTRNGHYKLASTGFFSQDIFNKLYSRIFERITKSFFSSYC